MAGWSELQAIRKENQRLEDGASRTPPVACPKCGSLLQVRGNVRGCPFGDFRWEQ